MRLFLQTYCLIVAFFLSLVPAVAETASSQQGNDISPAVREQLQQILGTKEGQQALVGLLQAQAGKGQPLKTTSDESAGGGNSVKAVEADAQSAKQAEDAQPPENEADEVVQEAPAKPLINLKPKSDSFASKLGDGLHGIFQQISYIGQQVLGDLSGYKTLISGEVPGSYKRFLSGLQSVFVVLLAAYVAAFLLRGIAKKLFSRAERFAEGRSSFFKGFLLVLTSLVDAGLVVFASGVGLVAALIMNEGETVKYVDTLTLDSFMLIEMVRVGLKFAFAPYRPQLRLLPFSEKEARFWVRHLLFAVGIYGFGVQLLVPLININVNWSLGNSVRITCVLITLVYLVVTILRSRERVQQSIRTYAAQSITTTFSRTLMKILGTLWHWVALAYVLGLFIVWIKQPYEAAAIIGVQSVLSLVVILISSIAIVSLNAIGRRGIRLSADISRALPALEGHLNRLLPIALTFARGAVALAGLLGLLEIWGLVSAFAWMATEEGSGFTGAIISALLIIVLGLGAWVVAMSWVDLSINEARASGVTARKRTLYKLFSNAFSILLVVIIVLMVLSELGVEIAPLIAGAGVLGLAVSFGSQKLVQDVINGAFIQLENAMNEGDFVTVAGISGTVERLNLRSVRLRDLSGTTHIIPFSAVDSVSNAMKDFAYHVAVIGVSYDTDIDLAKKGMHEAFTRLVASGEAGAVIGELEMQGIISFGASSVDLRARIKTVPGSQWAIGRAYNEKLKQVFDEWGIEIPFPQVTYHSAKSESEFMIPQEAERKLSAPSSVQTDNEAE
ncbi:mechanosensitive ion channel domain-containing protein [Polycladidibacter stylochi]|uniref:mechanosensitive ion channel domain-containing protein n=1 Tax=Polycladidibacter stylochi TaxID=1807766 RepID=UPI000831B46F|nr:mechanosensitive ion channel domain-containing protein [Pseudovibrio stylochi]